MWITDMRHFLDDNGMPVVSGPPGRVASYLGGIVLALGKAPFDELVVTGIPCRRRPGRRPCPGHICAIKRTNPRWIEWICPHCKDGGVIYNWEGTYWDREPLALHRDC